MSNRPFGVLVLGALAIAIAVVRLVIGFQLLFGGLFSRQARRQRHRLGRA